MPNIGNVVLRSGNFSENTLSISIDESISGLLFDISGFSDPFNNQYLLFNSFSDGQVQLINSLEEAADYGLDDQDFLGGLVYYHLSMFYDYVGTSKPLYIMFADCSSDWSAISTMQRACNGKMFQLGVWTHQNLWERDGYTGDAVFTRLVTNIETVAEELSGKVGQSSASSIPLSVVLCANTQIGINNLVLRQLPDGTMLNAPKVSVLLGQNGSDEVHAIQSELPNGAQVGSIGILMAIMSLAGVEENIGSVMEYNLNKNEKYQSPEIPINGVNYTLDDVSRVVQNTLTTKGYIVPTTYPAKEGECFWGSDPTLSNGDYSIISNNRVIHKCRRTIFSILLPYLHSNHVFSKASNGLSSEAYQMFEEAIGSALSGKLVNNGGKYQIDGYQIVELDTKNILNDDTINIKYTVSPINYNGTLTETVIAM